MSRRENDFWEAPQGHSPGPWRIGDYGDLEIFDDKENFATVWCHYYRTVEENLANARLISAAPELLAACAEMLSQLRDDYGEDDEVVAREGSRWQYAIDALVKAYGVDHNVDFADDDVDEVTMILREAYGVR